MDHIGTKKPAESMGLRAFLFVSGSYGNMTKQRYGASGGIRTHDPCLRRAVLYPAELRMQRRGSRGRPQSYASRRRESIPCAYVRDFERK